MFNATMPVPDVAEYPVFDAIETLTARERDILGLLEQGLSNQQMAECRSVSENTIKFHLKNIFAKLSVRNRLGAIYAARRQGLI